MVTILIIENYDVLRQALHNWLASVFPTCQIVAAPNRTDVASLCTVHMPDAIILNTGIAYKNSVEFVGQIRTLSPLAKIIMLSTHIDKTLQAHACTAGVDAILSTHSVAEKLQQTLIALLPILGETSP